MDADASQDLSYLDPNQPYSREGRIRSYGYSKLFIHYVVEFDANLIYEVASFTALVRLVLSHERANSIDPLREDLPLHDHCRPRGHADMATAPMEIGQNPVLDHSLLCDGRHGARYGG